MHLQEKKIKPNTSLKGVSVPLPSMIDQVVFDRNAAVRLGKALFWDMQVGSDGIQACASCHFSAGADPRAKNQLSPGIFAGDLTFAPGHGPNYTLVEGDFPRPRNDNDVSSSQGVFSTTFRGIVPGSPVDNGTLQQTIFSVNGIEVRRVEERNTPTVINAVFNFRNFWDGRANFFFNGVDPFGARNTAARVFVKNGTTVTAEILRLDSASLASQASGPPLNNNEMSFQGRTFRELGRKMLSLTPLGKQIVHPNDGVLGPIARSRTVTNGKGLTKSYLQLIQEAFRDKYWSATQSINGFTQVEQNFSMFFSVSVLLYQATLVSDDSPFDRSFLKGANEYKFTKAENDGKKIFEGKGKCVNCHGGPEFTNASVQNVRNEMIERMRMGDNQTAVYDNGFYNIGVRPTNEDKGVGRTDPFGNPLSFARQVVNGPVVDPNIRFDQTKFEVRGPIRAGERVAVDGAFKTPTLRNVELTGPYFHNGGKKTLKQVVDFYNRGGDFPNENIQNLDPDIEPLGLSSKEVNDLIAFLLTLTDERVRKRTTPFDHPQLFVPNGHPGSHTSVTNDGTGKATDQLLEIPAVGASGGPALRPFLDLNPFASVRANSPEQTLVPEGENEVPLVYELQQNHPNPFNPSTVIRYSIADDSDVRITLYNALGQRVATLVDEKKTAGRYELRFDGRNYASGVYFYKIEAGSFADSKKFVLIK